MRKVTGLAMLAALLNAVIAIIGGFSIYEDNVPYGTRSAFVIEEVNTGTKAEAIQAIQDAAEESQAVIIKRQHVLRDSVNKRVLFTYNGNDALYASLYGGGYPNFGGSEGDTTLKAASEITTEDLRGRYSTTLEEGELATVLTRLNERGIVANGEATVLAEALLLGLGRAHLVGSSVIVMLALVLALTYAVSRNRKIYALKKIHGYKPGTNLATEVQDVSILYVIALAITAAGTVTWLGWSTSFHQFGRLLPLLIGAGVAVYVFILLVTAAAVAVFGSVRVPTVLKGDKPVVRVGAYAVIVQLLVVIVAVVTINSSLGRVDAFNRALAAAHYWSAGDPLYVLRASISSTRADDEAAAPVMSTIIAEMEAKGALLLAQREQVPDNPDPQGIYGEQSLLVNNTYLQRSPVIGADGNPVSAVEEKKHSYTLLVPENYAGDLDTLVAGYSNVLGKLCPEAMDGQPCQLQPSVVRTRAGQSLPTYAQTGDAPIDLQASALITDPVLAVVPAQSGIIDTFMYMSYISQSAVLFSDVDELETRLTDAGIIGIYQGIDNAADAVKAAIDAANQEMAIDLLAIAMALAIVVAATGIMAMVYCDRWKRPMFVRLIHGYGFFARHYVYAASSGVVLLIAAVVALAAIHNNPLRDAAVAGALAAGVWGASLLMVRWYETRFRADYIKRD